MRAILLLLILWSSTAIAQQEELNIHNYPQNYFRNPLDIPIFLAGNFGECRPGHFHSGFDIKTKGEENQPVYAAADGYISRIKMDKGGFGHALYITHTNGYTTLYAHLNDLVPAIQQYVRAQQYEKERWDIDLQLTPQQFPVTKGQQIAWSGNTGSSTAPHLHFEIRDTKTEHPLNPALFGLPFTDDIAPTVYEVAIYDLNKSIYEQAPEILPLKPNGSLARAKGDTVQFNSQLIGIGINVKDFMNGSDNYLNFYTAELYLDDSLQGRIRLDDIGYDVSRYVNGYADYKTHEQQGKWIQCFFQLPGNKLTNIYESMNGGHGRLQICGDNTIASPVHNIRVVVADNKGNKTTVHFYLQCQKPTPLTDAPAFKAGTVNSFSNTDIFFVLDEQQLYDNIDFKYTRHMSPEDYSDKHQVHYSYVPIHHYFELNIKPNKVVPTALKNKIVIRYNDGKDEDGRAAIPTEQGWYKASVRNFGSYWLVSDMVAPVIKSSYKNGVNLATAKQISLTIKDSLTSVKRFRGVIDGKWVCFEQHGDQFFYKFDEHCGHGKHTLLFTAIDENNNTATYKLNFTR